MNATQLLSLDKNLSVPQLMQAPSSTNDRAELFDFVAMLQTSLDKQRLLDIFAVRLQSHMALRGINFQFHPTRVGSAVPGYRFGAQEGVRSACHVHAGDSSLGELSLFTREPLNAREKHWLDRLLSCLVHPLQNAMRYEAAQRLAHSDALTGVGNRAAYERAVEREMAKAERSKSPLSLLVLDLDAFKQLNDTYGHVVGDQCLRRLVAALAAGLRESDEVFRLGGDEFVVLLPHADHSAAAEIATRLAGLVAADATGPAMSASIGFAEWHAGMPASRLFEEADQALYAVKRAAA